MHARTAKPVALGNQVLQFTGIQRLLDQRHPIGKGRLIAERQRLQQLQRRLQIRLIVALGRMDMGNQQYPRVGIVEQILDQTTHLLAVVTGQ